MSSAVFADPVARYALTKHPLDIPVAVPALLILTGVVLFSVKVK